MDSLETLRDRIHSLLDRHPLEPSTELLDLLGEWWAVQRTEFGTKMEAWKALRIKDLSWDPPVFEFTIERHPGAWERIQRWTYSFDTNKTALVSERSPRHNEPYTAQQVARDARQIVKHIIRGGTHPSVREKNGLVQIRLGQLPPTKPVPYELPKRTAQGRQARLKAEVVRLMERQAGLQRVVEKETRGSLRYRRV